MEEDIRIENLINSIKIMSFNFEDQKLGLPDYCEVQDDIISEFDNCFLTLPALIREKRLSINSIAYIIQVKNLMEFAIRNTKTPEDFIHGKNWSKVRLLANETYLSLLAEN